MSNVLIVHGGGPTAVINASLAGVVGATKERVEAGEINKLYAAKNGTGGLLREDFLELGHLSERELALLRKTPGSAIGTSRDQLAKEDYVKMAEIVEKHGIEYVLFNGGNGTMDACGKLNQACRELGYDVKVVGIPKTMDNDIAVTDHSPGFGSAARFMAQSVRELVADVKGLPIHVVVAEASGRNAGWITAASALAAAEDGETTDCQGPDLIYLPEVPFDEERYIEDVKEALKRKTGVVVVASEGLKRADGTPVVEPVFKVGRATYFGDVSAHLANLVIKELGYKARGEKPGLLGRCSVALQSETDAREAELAGRLALEAALRGESGKMVAFRRVSHEPYRVETFLADIEEVMLCEKKLPAEFINRRGNGVTEEFKRWCRPLLGGALTDMISFN